MGYESKVKIVTFYENSVGRGYASVIASLDLGKMGYDIGWKEQFTESMADDKFYFYSEDGNTEVNKDFEDNYGDVLRYTTVDKLLEWAEKPEVFSYYQRDYPIGKPYRRYVLLREMLKTIKMAFTGETLYVVHIGY